jgi:hypothetical protein
MVNLLGAFVIILGFLSPWLIHLPAGLSILSTILICVGFLLLLQPNRKLTKASVWLKWGRIGVVINITGFLLLFFLTSIVLNTSLSDTNFGQILLRITRWIFMPITSLSETFLPYYEQIKMSDGSIGTRINFLKWTLASFLNVSLYIILAIIIGKLISKNRDRVRQI